MKSKRITKVITVQHVGETSIQKLLRHFTQNHRCQPHGGAGEKAPLNSTENNEYLCKISCHSIKKMLRYFTG